MPQWEAIRHGSHIFALAVAHDETRLACGGTADTPIAVWDLARTTVVAQLTGLPHQAHALAFSADGARLAAANVWGGLCVWSIADGRLLDRKPETTRRQNRSLVYAATGQRGLWPTMLADAVARPRQRALAPNGQVVAISQAGVQVRRYRTTTEVARFEPPDFLEAPTPVRRLAWSADSRWLALAGEDWAGAWRPLDDPPVFFGRALPLPEMVGALAMLGGTRQVLYAQGAAVAALDLPPAPRAPKPTPWQAFLGRLPDPAPGFKPRNDWQWNTTQWGYEGVRTLGGELLWYSHSHNTLAGGGALGQDFASFLATGPDRPVPEPILVEVCQAVLLLAGQRAD